MAQKLGLQHHSEVDSGGRERGELVFAAGSRAARESQLEWLGEQLAGRGIEDLGRPIRIVVPSRSLREHLAASCVARFGGAVAGVAIQTLAGLGESILARCGEASGARASDRALFALRVRGLARRERALRTPTERRRRRQAGALEIQCEQRRRVVGRGDVGSFARHQERGRCAVG